MKLDSKNMAPLVIALAPLGVKVVEMLIEIIRKDALGTVTPQDYLRLIIYIKSMEMDLDEVLAKLNPKPA